MAPATSAARIFGLLAVLLTLAGAQDSMSTTGGAPDAGTATPVADSFTDCGGTKAPTDPMGPGETPAPTLSFRCLPSSQGSYSDTPSPTAGGETNTTMDTPSPSEAAATPEPTVVADSTGMVPPESTTGPSAVMPTEAGADGNRDVTTTSAPTTAATMEDDMVDAGEDEGADAVPTTPAPTNEDGQTAEEAAAAGDSTDGAFGLAAPSASGAAMAASCGLLLAVGLLAL